jgi:hypothetical protein
LVTGFGLRAGELEKSMSRDATYIGNSCRPPSFPGHSHRILDPHGASGRSATGYHRAMTAAAEDRRS